MTSVDRTSNLVAEADAAVGGIVGLAREKYWRERNAEERAEVLAEVVAYLLRQVAELNDTVRKLEQHGHGVGGQVLTPLRPSRPGELDYNPTPHFIEKIGQGPRRD